MHLTRRSFLAAAGAVAFGGPAFAAFPEKPIRLIVPYGGGGMGSVFGTHVTDVLTAQLEQRVFAEYKPGANAQIGTEQVKDAPPDGYTLLMATTSSIAINPAFLPHVKYDPLEDFTPISIVWISRNVLFSNAQKAKTFKELVALGKKQSLTYGSLGVGTLAHLSSEMLLRETKIQAVHVPYKGQGQIMVELAGGSLDFAFTDPSGIAQATAGRVVPLAVTGNRRLPSAPEVPTMAELGYPNIGTESWIAILGPKGMPKEAVERISSALQAGFADEEMKAKVAASGAEVAPDMSPQYFEKELRSEVERWKKFQQETKITIGQ